MDTRYTEPLQLYDRSLTIKRVIEVYDSYVWTDVYCGLGDFELKIPNAIAKGYNINQGDFIECPVSEVLMVVEAISQEYGTDNSVITTYKGRSIESILCRRVLRKEDVPKIVPQYDSHEHCYVKAELRKVWECIQYVLERTIVQNEQDGTHAGLSFPSRGVMQLGYTIPEGEEFVGEQAKLAPYVNVDGITVYEYIQGVLNYHGFGFKIKYYPNGEIGGSTITDRVLRFEVYNGVNRGYTQDLNERIIFSPDDDTTYKMDTSSDFTDFKNASMILGPNIPKWVTDNDGQDEIVDTDKRYTTELYSGVSGLDRYELFVDASNIETTDKINGRICDTGYIVAQMRYKAIKELKKYLTGNITCNPSCNFDPYKIYKTDYDLGDVVTIIDTFETINIVRISSFSHSVDSSGYKRHPNFESIPPIGGYRALEQMSNNEDIIRSGKMIKNGSTINILRVTEDNNLELFDNTEVGDL